MISQTIIDTVENRNLHRKPQHTNFISPTYYTSMGFAVPAAVGAQFSMSDTWCLVIVGKLDTSPALARL